MGRKAEAVAVLYYRGDTDQERRRKRLCLRCGEFRVPTGVYCLRCRTMSRKARALQRQREIFEAKQIAESVARKALAAKRTVWIDGVEFIVMNS